MYTEKSNKADVCIVGAGLVGSLLAILLAERGFSVDLIEKRSDMRIADIPGGRTIAMSISNRGWKGLQKVGLDQEILKNTVAKSARKVHMSNGSTQRQEYGRNGQSIYTIDRKYLNSKLLSRAEQTGLVNIIFDTACTKVDYDTCEVELLNAQNGLRTTNKYQKIIGADGVFSVIAQGMFENQVNGYNRFSPEYGYKELVIPPDENQDYKLDPGVVHVWPRGSFNLVALPNINKSFTCTLFLKFEGKTSLSKLDTHEKVIEFFHEYFSDVAKLIPDLSDQFIRNPISKIYSLKCSPWHYKKQVLLIGDASHAIAPFFAMGMNVGFEDCTVFDNLLEEYNNDLDTVFERFSNVRVKDTDAIADMSLKNFTSLGISNDKNYHKKWLINRKLWEKLNDDWVPLYPMIAFSSIPFSEIAIRSQRQNDLLSAVFENENVDEVNDQLIDYICEKYLKKSTL